MRGMHILWKLQTSASKILPTFKNHCMLHRIEKRATGKKGTLGTAIKETRGEVGGLETVNVYRNWQADK